MRRTSTPIVYRRKGKVIQLGATTIEAEQRLAGAEGAKVLVVRDPAGGPWCIYENVGDGWRLLVKAESMQDLLL